MELSQSLAIVLRHRQLRVLLLTFAVANLFTLGLIGVGIPLFAKEVLKAGPQILGTLLCHRLPRGWQQSPQVIFGLFMLSDCLLTKEDR
ncbi:hypothetical protein ABH926_006268 [Catenulispora sp. GP43]|uniref:hypothetical protein n=1 Tax=Catenulispora sp. GP43 TaxID=3156263 RepID=UPI003519280A